MGGGAYGGQGGRGVGVVSVDSNFRLGNLRVSVGFITAVTYAHSQKMQLESQSVALRISGPVSFCKQGIKAWEGELICLMPHSKVATGLGLDAGPLDPWHPCHPTVPPVEIPEQNKLTGPGRGQVGGGSQMQAMS